VIRREGNKRQLFGFIEEKLQTRLAAVSGKDRTVITQPSIGTALLGAGAQAADILRREKPDLLSQRLTFGGRRSGAPVTDRSTQL